MIPGQCCANLLQLGQGKMYQVPHFPQSRDRRLTRNLGRVMQRADFCDFAVQDKAHIYDGKRCRSSTFMAVHLRP
jgi:hypothetical protein